MLLCEASPTRVCGVRRTNHFLECNMCWGVNPSSSYAIWFLFILHAGNANSLRFKLLLWKLHYISVIIYCKIYNKSSNLPHRIMRVPEWWCHKCNIWSTTFEGRNSTAANLTSCHCPQWFGNGGVLSGVNKKFWYNILWLKVCSLMKFLSAEAVTAVAGNFAG